MGVPANIKTQKARGILSLSQWQPSRFSNGFVKQVLVYPHNAVTKFPFFARPCPLKPRHGFVDSRMIRTKAEWDAMLAEIEASGEEQFEVIMMPFIPCTWSGILTPAGLTFGAGHDGATSGNGAKQVPASSLNRLEFLKAFALTHAADEGGVKETPFLEFVEHHGHIEAVQLRNGPAVPVGNAYVPKDMVIEHVIKANGEDLMEWEKKMKQVVAEGWTGVAIWHPGGAMSSHYAVQAIEQSKSLESPFAVLIQDAEPLVGATLHQTSNVAEKLSADDYSELSKMLAFAITNMTLEKDDYDAAIHLAIAALHAQALWGPERHLLVLRAAALTFMLRFASAAILGELRHWKGGPGGSGKERKTVLFELDSTSYLSREQVYERAFEHHVKHIAPRMETAFEDFMAKGWGASYGGKKWANCTKMTGNLFTATAKFLTAPSDKTWQHVTTCWNHVVNVFHNTGQLLNKFINVTHMDVMARVPAFGLVSDLVGSLVVDSDDFGIHRNPVQVASMINVTLPEIKAMKPKPIVIPDELNARWNMLPDTKQVYVQIQLPFTVNKDYGMAQAFKVGNGLYNLLATIPTDGNSLTGSSTKKCKGTVVCMNNVMVLKTTQHDIWVPLCSDDFLKNIIKTKQSGIEHDDQ